MQSRIENLIKPIALSLMGFVVVGLATFASSEPPAFAGTPDGAALYQANCSACHQADAKGIPGSFPPLAGNPEVADTDFVAEVIRNGLTGPIEVLGESYDGVMPPIANLGDDEIDAIAAYVAGLADQTDEPAAPPAEEEPAAVIVPDIDRGRDYFVGTDRFDNGAPACAACHTAGSVGNLGGSSLGPNLTGIVEEFNGEVALSAWLTNPPAPTMSPLFSDHELTEAEIADVAAFLADAPNQKQASNDVDAMTLAGLGGLVVLLGGMAVAWRGMRQTYRDRLKTKVANRSAR